MGSSHMNEHFRRNNKGGKKTKKKEEAKIEVPLYDPYTGEPNPHYEELTGKKNPLIELRKNSNISPQPSFEPKRENRYTVTLPPHFAIPEYCVANTSRPTIKVVPRYWLGMRMGNETIWENITFDFYDPIQPSVSESLMKVADEWMDEYFKYTLDILDPTGHSVETWEISECEIISIEFGELGYDKDGIIKCRMTIKPGDVRLKK